MKDRLRMKAWGGVESHFDHFPPFLLNKKKKKAYGRTHGPTDGPTDGLTDRPTKQLIESRARDKNLSTPQAANASKRSGLKV